MEAENHSEFSHEILERFQKLIKTKKSQIENNNQRIGRALTRQITNTNEEIK